MKQEKTIFLNDKGILLVCVIIMTLTFALGFMTSNRMKEENYTFFTREDLRRIAEMQTMEDKRESGAEIYAYKDENGNLMIGWECNDSEKN